MMSFALTWILSLSPSPVTMSTLLAEMGDRDSLARMPAPAFRQLHASSYDRSQTDPSDAKTWFNNADYGQFIRAEKHGDRTEWVVMEHAGPGAITRIWTPLSADKNAMLVRFYFNGSPTPAIEEKFNDLMRGRGPVKSPFAFVAWPDPKVTDGVAGDLYFPIPFSESCKITMSEVPFYYSFDYRAYPTGTPVENFNWDRFRSAAAELKTTSEALNFSRRGSAGQTNRLFSKIAPGGAEKLDLPSGSRAITELEVDVPKNVDPQVLRSTVLQISFDGEGAVFCPIGEFFGAGTRLKPVADRYRQVTAKGAMTSIWRMPYEKSAKVRLYNYGSAPVALRLKVKTQPWDWDLRSMHFHGTWRNQSSLATRPMSDWNYLEATGQGVYVGDTLTVMNPSPSWYGEGDEKVYVDGESFPSHLGTGTEDYYGYAWGMAEQWSSPYMAMPARDVRGRENWLGYTTTSRVRGLDGIPFDRSLKFDMEIWHWADCQVAYSAATFWYARPGATSNRAPEPDEAARLLPAAPGQVPGALEGESLELVAKSAGTETSIQTAGLVQGTWSGGAQLFLQGHQVGDFAELRVPARKRGKSHLVFYGTKSYDYGIVRFSLNGKPIKDVDFWAEKAMPSGPIDLGEVDLPRKGAILKLEIVGTNPRSTGGRYFSGIDCLLVEPAG